MVPYHADFDAQAIITCVGVCFWAYLCSSGSLLYIAATNMQILLAQYQTNAIHLEGGVLASKLY